jgi:outer membrane protein assembly factor BamE (lipoprotein component of BamABCDE complex)
MAMLLTGCTPIVSQRGYLNDPNTEAEISVGQDTKGSVETKLGDPSMRATFGEDAWYYVSSVEKQVAFFTPIVEKRKILAVHFDAEGKVTDLLHYDLKDGHIVAFETRQTPSRGREMTFLQQLFNATPGMPGTMDQERNPGGGGIPPSN